MMDLKHRSKSQMLLLLQVVVGAEWDYVVKYFIITSRLASQAALTK